MVRISASVAKEHFEWFPRLVAGFTCYDNFAGVCRRLHMSNCCILDYHAGEQSRRLTNEKHGGRFHSSHTWSSCENYLSLRMRCIGCFPMTNRHLNLFCLVRFESCGSLHEDFLQERGFHLPRHLIHAVPGFGGIALGVGFRPSHTSLLPSP